LRHSVDVAGSKAISAAEGGGQGLVSGMYIITHQLSTKVLVIVKLNWKMAIKTLVTFVHV